MKIQRDWTDRMLAQGKQWTDYADTAIQNNVRNPLDELLAPMVKAPEVNNLAELKHILGMESGQ